MRNPDFKETTAFERAQMVFKLINCFSPYELHVETKGGGTLCYDCATKKLKRHQLIHSWFKDDQIEGFYPYFEGPSLLCDDCDREITAEYGDPEENENA